MLRISVAFTDNNMKSFDGSFLPLTAATEKSEKRGLTTLQVLPLPHIIESAKQK